MDEVQRINNFKWRNGKYNEIVKSLGESGLLIKGISEANKNEAKVQKGGFLSMLLGTLAASILGKALSVKRSNNSRWRSNKSGWKFWNTKVLS